MRPRLDDPYHAGERAAQARAGVTGNADRVSAVIRDRMPEAARAFLADQRFAVIAAADRGGRMWAAPLTGPAGFLTAAHAREIRVAAAVPPEDPLHPALSEPTDVGGIAVEFASRRRMRFNGRSRPTAGGWTITVEQVVSNCPQYIQRRAAAAGQTLRPASVVARGTALTGAQRELVSGADTFFLATRSAAGAADVSHRGGRPGFAVPTATTLTWPDYPGNAMMLSNGNLLQERRAGLLFLDWGSGTTLQLTGEATVDWDPAAAADRFPSAERVLRLRLTEVVEIAHRVPLAWSTAEQSRFNPPVP